MSYMKLYKLNYGLFVEAGGVSYTYDAENTRIATTEDGLAPGRKKPLNF